MCSFYRRYIKNFTYISAILTDLMKKSTTCRCGHQEQQALDNLKDRVANATCSGVPGAQGEIILLIDTSNIGGRGTLFQWQAPEKEEFNSGISQWGTEGWDQDRSLKHGYSEDKKALVPKGHMELDMQPVQG